MGGKALNKYNIHTERKNTKEFLTLVEEIRNKIQGDFKFLLTAVVKYYHTKESHGDLDLLLRFDKHHTIDLRKYIQETFHPQAIHNNGGVFSFDYKNFQIDFISIMDEKWEIANVYYSYDCTGNAMGKTFHKFGLSYGWNGLFYKYRNSHGTNSGNILLTTDARKIFEFGGYDYDRFLLGFETLEDIFKFVINGKYFNADIFQMENLKSIDRKRNRKRDSYHLFLKYLKDNNIISGFNFNENKDSYLPIINEYFPDANLLEKINELQELDKKNKVISQKFNGDLVMAWLPNLKGRELGDALKKFKDALGDDYENFILNNKYITIYNHFMSIYRNF